LIVVYLSVNYVLRPPRWGAQGLAQTKTPASAVMGWHWAKNGWPLPVAAGIAISTIRILSQSMADRRAILFRHGG